MFLSLGINCPSVAGSLWDEATEFLLVLSEISAIATVWVISKSYIFDRRERITSYPHLPQVTPTGFPAFFALCDRMNIVPMKLRILFHSSEKAEWQALPCCPGLEICRENRLKSVRAAWISVFSHSWGCPHVAASPLTLSLLKMQNLPSTRDGVDAIVVFLTQSWGSWEAF